MVLCQCQRQRQHIFKAGAAQPDSYLTAGEHHAHQLVRRFTAADVHVPAPPSGVLLFFECPVP